MWSWRGQLGVEPYDFPPVVRVWLDYLLTHTANWLTVYPDPLTYALSGNSQKIARPVQNTVVALLAAFKATQSTELLDRALVIMDAAYSTLSDVDGDGRLEWYDLGDGTFPEWVPTEDSMNTYMADTLAVRWCYIMKINRTLKAEYETSYQQWWAYINNTVLADPFHGVESRTFMHTYAANLALRWYLWRLTENPNHYNLFLQRWNVINGSFVERQTTHGTALIWDHRPLIDGVTPMGCQWSDYASYVIMHLCDLAFDDCPVLTDSFMESLLNTARDLVFVDGLNAIRDDVCGEEYPEGYPAEDFVDNNYANRRYAVWNWHGLVAWDTSGRLDSFATPGLNAISQPTISIPSYQLAGMIRREVKDQVKLEWDTRRVYAVVSAVSPLSKNQWDTLWNASFNQPVLGAIQSASVGRNAACQIQTQKRSLSGLLCLVDFEWDKEVVGDLLNTVNLATEGFIGTVLDRIRLGIETELNVVATSLGFPSLSVVLLTNTPDRELSAQQARAYLQANATAWYT